MEVRCPTPGCGKLIVEYLKGTVRFTCRKCRQTHTVTR